MPPAATGIPIAVFGAPVDHVAGEDDVADEAILRALVPRLHRCVAALPAREREVIRLHYGIGCEPRALREMATLLEVSVGTLHSAERRALDLLRDWL